MRTYVAGAESWRGLDLRLAPAASGAWLGAAAGVTWPPGVSVGLGAGLWAAAVGLGGLRRWLAVVLALVAAGAGLLSGAVRVESVRAGPLESLAAAGAWVHLSGTVGSDPVVKPGAFTPYALLRLSADAVERSGAVTRVRTPVLVIAPASWSNVAFGSRVDVFGHLEPAQGQDIAAVLVAQGRPRLERPPPWPLRAVGRLRDGLAHAAEPLPVAERALLPALVDGDISRMPADTTAQFQATGLTHLLAVSGSNLTLVLGFVLFLARWARVTGHGRQVVGLGAVGLFVLLARPDPSVLRAAAMGVVSLAGLAGATRARGVRTLCAAVCLLVLADPWLATAAGFVLSALATAGIVLLAPVWQAGLARWIPSWLAEALAVPLAAQIACTPVIALISGQVSLIAVLANAAAAPAVGPATVTSLLAGLADLVWPDAAQLAARVAGLPLTWIVGVASHGAALAGADVAWGAGPAALALLVAVCAALVVVMPRLLCHPVPCLVAAGMLVVALLHPVPRLGWPPTGWVMAACDVGQGDGLVLNAGGGSAVVVDTGPDPAPMGACLRGLGVHTIPLVVLTHYHSDHVDGLPAVLGGWHVGAIETSPLRAPSDRVRAVRQWASDAHVPMTTARVGERQRVGDLAWTVIGPPRSALVQARAEVGAGDEGTGPNNGSLVLMLRVAGIRVLLSGDAQTEEQDAILATGVSLRADVLKEPHHGSANIDPRFLAATGARVSVISVGAGNPYGHPKPQTLDWLAGLGIRVYRTDQDGTVAVVVREGQISVATSR